MTHVSKMTLAIKSLIANIDIKIIASSILGFLSYSLGYDYIAVTAIAYLVGIDLLMGIAVSIKHKRFSSASLGVTLYKLFIYMMLLIMAHQALHIHFVPDFFDDMIEALIAVTEIISILENSALLGFKYARAVQKKINEFVDDKLNK